MTGHGPVLREHNGIVGRMLIVMGLAIAGLGLVATLAVRFPMRGDVVIRGKYGTFYFPVVTCLVVSVVLSILSWLFSRR